MLHKALKLIETELKNYVAINSDGNFTKDNVLLGNIGMAELDGGQNLNDKLVITLANLEEERTLKNRKNHVISPTTNQLEIHRPPINLNLYVLFSANFSNNYEQALMMLGLVIRFFQGRNVFTVGNSLFYNSDEDEDRLKLIFNIYTTTFEQLNHLWGSLGGKSYPFVLYRLWLIEEEDKQPQSSGELIQDIEVNTASS